MARKGPGLTPVKISADAARRLFLDAQGLLTDPGSGAGRRPTRRELLRLVERLGFVQIDSINVVARAHDLLLHSRLDGYRIGGLAELFEDERRPLFEGFTHDASVIPTTVYAHWKPRFRRDRQRLRGSAWWRQLLGDDAERMLERVRERIAAEGPLGSADFEHPGRRGAWWDWKPAKAALDFLWRCGELAVPRRVNFQKLYDLAERVYPTEHALPEPEPDAHLLWAAGSAAERLVVFTARELCEFYHAVDAGEAERFCRAAAREGRIVPAEIASADGSEPQVGWALADWERRLGGLPASPSRLRLLSPFDPVLRDRRRALRRFGFDYRFEAFTPSARRRYGYYVLPILKTGPDGERLIGRLDAKLHRERGVLEVRGLWWERGIRPTRPVRAALDDALGRLATLCGAAELELPP